MTRGKGAWAAAFAVATLWSATNVQAAHDLASVVAGVDRGFVCPEFLADDNARRDEVLAFSQALATVGPTRLTYRQAAYIRARILERHNCARGTSAVATTGSAQLGQAASPASAAVANAPASLQP